MKNNYLRETRIIRGYTQQQIATELGYSTMAISHFERGTRSIPPHILSKWLKILGGLEEKMAPNRKVYKPCEITTEGAKAA
ncbi:MULTISPECIES: helix-turn-helix transcriptional regulator [Sphingomonadales]|jgi:transcriptional regulator with XRE-family HTH domain|tara:strand:+ start:3546 stop:3788 length:243 start_codon:yes stop_codon:yes gene_type:complete